MTCHVVGQGQLKLPSAREGKAIQVGDDLYGERSAGKATLAAGRAEVVVGDCVSEGGHGSEDSAEIPAGSTAAERDATKAYVANATRSVRRELGRDSATTRCRARLAGQDTV